MSENTAVRNETQPKHRRQHSPMTVFLAVLDTLLIIMAFLIYGPYHGFRDWYITEAMNTGTHQYLAYVFYSQQTITEVMNANTTIVSGDPTDVSKITFEDTSNITSYSSVYEQAVLQHDPDQDYKLIPVSGSGWSGWLTAIYDPSHLRLVTVDSAYGAVLTTYAEQFNARVAINAGGMYVLNSDNTYTPLCSFVMDGTVLRNTGYTEPLIAMNTDGVLILNYDTLDHLMEQYDLQWATAFSPYLVVNGVKSTFNGNGGYGTRARSAIAQRQDGIVLLATIDGTGGSMTGIGMEELADLLIRYGAYNAVNLDGGGSTMLTINGELYNNPEGFGYSGERWIREAIIYE